MKLFGSDLRLRASVDLWTALLSAHNLTHMMSSGFRGKCVGVCMDSKRDVSNWAYFNIMREIDLIFARIASVRPHIERYHMRRKTRKGRRGNLVRLRRIYGVKMRTCLGGMEKRRRPCWKLEFRWESGRSRLYERNTVLVRRKSELHEEFAQFKAAGEVAVNNNSFFLNEEAKIRPQTVPVLMKRREWRYLPHEAQLTKETGSTNFIPFTPLRHSDCSAFSR